MENLESEGPGRMRANPKMATTDRTSEEDLASLLPGDPGGFIELLYAEYREKLAACVGKAGKGMLNEADIAEVIQETMVGVWTTIQKAGFKPDGPLKMVFRIARNKAVDACRRKGRFIGANESDVTDLIIDDLANSDLGLEYRLASEEEKRRLVDVLPDIIAALPSQQRFAVTAFRECYEEIRKKNVYRPVAEAMTRLSGEHVSVAAAKSALKAGLEKVRRELIRHGIGFVERREI